MDRVLLRKTAAANMAKDVDLTKLVPALNVKQLFDGYREIRLFHGSEEYRLMLTKNNKLILTK